MRSAFTSCALDRRQMLRTCGASAVLVTLIGPSFVAFADTTRFSIDERALLGAIADTIIPDTDTIGASKAGVPDFIELIFTEWMDAPQQAAFRQGMTAFEAAIRTTAGVPFDRLSPARREALLQSALVSAQAVQKAADHKGHAPFLVWMKRLTVHGYYTSEAGASQELVLNVTPGEYVGCHQMAPGERSFSMDRRHIPFINDNDVVRIK